MHSDQQPYRELYDEMLRYEGGALYTDLLRPWLRNQGGERRWLEQVRKRPANPVPPIPSEELWRLYALSRIVDLLQLSFAPPIADHTWNIPSIGRDDYAEFMTGLGLEPVERAGFHPFHHEVVTLEQLPDGNAPPVVTHVYWPGYKLGSLLISRAGCAVRAGRNHMLKEVAERSTLYWAYARNNRPTEDLSNGWGGNSQWRTSFRRDYEIDGTLYYNVDARDTPGATDPELDDMERLELLRHRCFVTCTKRSDDRLPWNFRHTENA